MISPRGGMYPGPHNLWVPAPFDEELNYYYCYYYLSRCNSVSILSEYRLDDRGSIPGRKTIIPLASVIRPALTPTQPPIQWVP
jgi:hypothetical protein